MNIDTIETFEAMQNRFVAQEARAKAKRAAFMRRDTFSANLRRADAKRSIRAKVARFFGL